MIVKTYQINGMHCMGCVKKVQQAFVSHNHISEANVNLVLIRKDNFSIVRRRPEFIEEAFKRLIQGPQQ